MSQRRIVCTEQTGCSTGGHITGVGVDTDNDGFANTQLTVHEVYVAMNSGDTFYTYGGGKVASVHRYRCGCGRDTLRSGADATTENNLDSLRLCAWKAA